MNSILGITEAYCSWSNYVKLHPNSNLPPVGLNPAPVTEIILLLIPTTISLTVGSFLVNVPVLSVHITVTDPSVSALANLLISACFFAATITPIARVILQIQIPLYLLALCHVL